MTKKPKPSAKSAIQKEVMGKIHGGSVRMKPRIYFTILWLFGVASGVAASLTFAYLVSMLVFITRIQTSSTPAYGARHNLSDAIATFPWWAVFLSLGLAIVAIWLMRKYGRIYRYKISYVVTLFILCSLLIGVMLSIVNIGHSDGRNTKPSNNGMHLQDGSGRNNQKN